MSNPQTSEEAKNLGNAALKEGKPQVAIEWFTRAIGLVNPGEPAHVLYSNRSAAQASCGNYAEALKDAEKAIELKPDWPRGYSRRATALHFLGRLEEAREGYKKALEMDPGNATLKESLTQVETALKEKEERESRMSDENMPDMGGLPPNFRNPFEGDIIERLRKNPETAPFMNDPEFCKTMLEIKENPDKLNDHMNDMKVMLALQALLGITPEMREKAQRAQEEREDRERARKAEEEARKKKEEEERKKKEEEEALARRPPQQLEAEKFKEEGNTAYRAKNFTQAIAMYQKAHDTFPDDATYLSNLAAAYLENKEVDKCIETCEKGLADAQRLGQYALLPRFYTRLGNAYMKMKNYDEAIKQYQLCVNESRTAENLERLNKAERTKREAIRLALIDPEKAREAKERGNAHFQKGEYPEAVAAYTEAISHAPEDPIMYSNRAAAYMKLGEFPTALRDCDKCLELNPKFVKGYSRKGTCHFFMKEYHKAMEAYDKGHAVDPTNQECIDGIEKVERTVAAQQGKEADEEQLRHAMADPEIRAILSDPVMQKVLQDFQTDPAAAQHHLQDPAIMGNIQKLAEAGVIRLGSR